MVSGGQQRLQNYRDVCPCLAPTKIYISDVLESSESGFLDRLRCRWSTKLI
jgi:hypothetical protein